MFLSGDNSQVEREQAIQRLEQEEMENRLDYIFTVDIFNEGADIPQVNQVWTGKWSGTLSHALVVNNDVEMKLGT